MAGYADEAYQDTKARRMYEPITEYYAYFMFKGFISRNSDVTLHERSSEHPTL
jgi:hypothetical protein